MGDYVGDDAQNQRRPPVGEGYPRETDVCIGLSEAEAARHPGTRDYRMMLDFNRNIFADKSDLQREFLAESIVDRFWNGKGDAKHFYRLQVAADGQPARWVGLGHDEATELTIRNLEEYPTVVATAPKPREGKRKFEAAANHHSVNDNEPLQQQAAARRETGETATRISSSASNSKKQRSTESLGSAEVAPAAAARQRTPPTVKTTNSARNVRHRLAAAEGEIRPHEFVGPPPLGDNPSNNHHSSETTQQDDRKQAARPASQSSTGDHNSTPRHDNLNEHLHNNNNNNNQDITMEIDRVGAEQPPPQQQPTRNDEPRRPPPRRRHEEVPEHETPLLRAGQDDEDGRRNRNSHRNDDSALPGGCDRHRDPQRRGQPHRGKEHLHDELRDVRAADEERAELGRRGARGDNHRDPMVDYSNNRNNNNRAPAAGAFLRDEQDNHQPLEADEPAASAPRDDNRPPSVIVRRHDDHPRNNDEDDDNLTEPNLPDLNRRPPIGPPARDGDALDPPRADIGDIPAPPRRVDDAYDRGVGSGTALNRPVDDDDARRSDRDRPGYRDDFVGGRHSEDPRGRSGSRQDNDDDECPDRSQPLERRRGHRDDGRDEHGYPLPRGVRNVARLPVEDRETEGVDSHRQRHSPSRYMYRDSDRRSRPPYDPAPLYYYGSNSSDEDEQSVFVVNKRGERIGKARPSDLPPRVFEGLARGSRPRSSGGGGGGVARRRQADPTYDSPDDARRGDVVSGHGEEQQFVYMRRSENRDERSPAHWDGDRVVNVARSEPRWSVPDHVDRRRRNSDYPGTEPRRRVKDEFDDDYNRRWSGREEALRRKDAHYNDDHRPLRRRRQDSEYDSWEPSHAPVARRSRDDEYRPGPYYHPHPPHDMEPLPRQQRPRQDHLSPRNEPHDRAAATAAAAQRPQEPFEDRAYHHNDVGGASDTMRPPPNDMPGAAAAGAAPANRAQSARHARSHGQATTAAAVGEYGDQNRSSRPSGGAALRQASSLEEANEVVSLINLEADNNTLGSLTDPAGFEGIFDQNSALQGLADQQHQRNTTNGTSDNSPQRRQHSQETRPSGNTNSQSQRQYSQQNARPAAGPPPPDRKPAARNNHPPGRY